MILKQSTAINEEVKMTMGCTDPGAVAYAAAKAAHLLGDELKSIDVVLSRSVYKNALFVHVPIVKKCGVELAALLGALVKRPEMKLTVLAGVDSDMLESLKDVAKSISVSVRCLDTDEPLYISVTCGSGVSRATVVIKGDYDFICHMEKDNQTLYHCEPKAVSGNNMCRDWSFEELFLSATEDFDGSSILEYERINREASQAGLSEELKLYIERLLQMKDVSISDMANMARIYVFHASKMRMSGEKVLIASLAGSGNLGITAMLAVSAVCDARMENPRKRAQAQCLSMMTAIYIKGQMNRLTVMCGTAIAGAAGAAAATAYLMGGGCKEVKNAVDTVIGSIGGILCDGAKESCAFKVGFAAECGVMSGYMAAKHLGIRQGRGIITGNTDKNIKNLGLINNEGMTEADNIMIEILNEQKEFQKYQKRI
ncbi:L-cysteine desulfidase [Anaerobacterium chartisolvens]|uniref:L-cysteine desulfidase n=1 Tax=Anaerobacterium chartisolvens TaxID=1297424 RepID=A0A369BEE9_9FIRM|nr:L-serine ammonia-lyase, iron-sulfur-dependent, subunit alpha [Anaerobacterium chartisolvens]RCX19943.1 L-cysteine desulfidase [Anaerobacterium chartisolvens]